MLVCPPTVDQITVMSLAAFVAEMIRSAEPGLFGSVPARNSAWLFRPSPSGSALAAAWGQPEQPKCANCHCSNAVRPVTVNVAVLLVTLPAGVETITEYAPISSGPAAAMFNVAPVWPTRLVPALSH